MEYRQLNGSGLFVPALSLGTATFGGTHGFEGWGNTGVAEATRMVDMCLEAGLNLFDTADIYSRGLSEEILGKAISGKRNRLLISTKATFPMGEDRNEMGASRFHIINACEASLRRLGTDNLVQSGKVRYIGCSNFSGWQLMKSLAVSDKYGWTRYVAHQVYYSLLNREFEWELMPLGVDQQVGTFVWSPLAAGRLGGRYRRNNPIPEDGRVARGGAPVGDEIMSYDLLYNIIDILEDIAGETRKTVAQVALNWLLQRPTICSLVIGARTEEHLKLNLGAIGWSLTAEQIKRLDEASKTPKIYPYWHQNQFPELKSQLIF